MRRVHVDCRATVGEVGNGDQGRQVRPFVSVGSVETKPQKGGAGVVARLDGRSRIAAIETKDILDQVDPVFPAKGQQFTAKMIIEGAGLIHHAHNGMKFRRILVGGHRCVVDHHHFGHVAVNRRRSAVSHLFENRENQMAVDRQGDAGPQYTFDGRQ